MFSVCNMIKLMLLLLLLLLLLMLYRDCRRMDAFEAFSVNRIASVIWELYRYWTRRNKEMPVWVMDSLSVLGIKAVNPVAALVEQKKLFDKKRSHVVAIW